MSCTLLFYGRLFHPLFYFFSHLQFYSTFLLFFFFILLFFRLNSALSFPLDLSPCLLHINSPTLHIPPTRPLSRFLTFSLLLLSVARLLFLLRVFIHSYAHHTLPYLTIPYHTLPYLTLPYHTLPYLTLPYLTIPYLTLPYLTILTLPYLT